MSKTAAERSREWRAANPGYHEEWKKRNPSKTAEYARAYRARDPEKVRERNRIGMQKRRDANREKYREQMRKWNRENPEKIRAKSLRIHLRTFGLTPEMFQEMLDAQGGGCAICGGLERKGHALSVDHCHATGKVRGLLCGNCNRGLGLYKDNPERLIKAAEYLRK